MERELLSVTVLAGVEGSRGCVVVRLEGRFDGAGAARFDGTVLPLFSGSAPAAGAATGCVLDFAGVSFLSSAGIRSVVRAAQAADRRNATLVLAAVTPFVTQVLDLSGLLGSFRIAPSVEEAVLLSRPAGRDGRLEETVTGGRRYAVTSLGGGGAHLEAWGSAGGAELESPSLADLGIALGVGGLGTNREEAARALGPFLSTGRLVALAPGEGREDSDFLLTERPAESVFHVSAATGIAGDPALLVELPGERIPAGELARDLVSLAAKEGTAPGPSIAFVVVSGAAAWGGRPEAPGLVAVGLAGPGFQVHAVTLSAAPPADSSDSLAETLRGTISLERLSDASVLDPSVPLVSPRAWVFVPGEVRRGAEKMTAVEAAGDGPFPDEWLSLARRIYRDSSRVRLTRLAGGYSSSAFQAESWDREGRRTIPTVLKIATHAFTDREEKAYHACVKNFILNNATVIMGRAVEGGWSGLRYNFLGVNGPESRLAWLAERYETRPFEEVEPLLDLLFGRILDPWYGQTREEEIHLGAEHDPSGLFPRLAEDAREALGVDPEAEEVDCPEVGARLPNPYLFLRRPAGAPRERLRWPVCITHGDLNPNNVLLDEKENIYIIDFSETRVRNAVSDFARLEALAALQSTRVDDEADAARVCRFFERLVSVPALPGPVPPAESGDDPSLQKAGRLISCLRRHAARIVAPRTDLVPYLWPLLQWTAPIVSFRQIPPLQKRVSMVASALVVRRILAG